MTVDYCYGCKNDCKREPFIDIRHLEDYDCELVYKDELVREWARPRYDSNDIFRPCLFKRLFENESSEEVDNE